MRWISFLFLMPSLAMAGSLSYDLDHPYQNPLATSPYAGCEAGAEFYQVYRQLMPLVTHTFIGARVHGQCDGKEFETLEIYGASKGPSDRALFVQKLGTTNASNLEFLGAAGPADAFQALAEATRISLEWQHDLQNPAYFYPRVIATPIAGRPCAVSALQIRRDLRPFLVK